MKENLIYLFLTVVLLILGNACEVTQSTPSAENILFSKTNSQLDKSDKNSEQIKFLGKNNHAIFDFVNLNGKFLGYGNGGSKIFINENLFVSNEVNKSWEISEILPEIDKNPGFKKIFVKDNNIWAVAGRWVLKKNSNSDWKHLAKLPTFELVDIGFADDKTGFVLSSLDLTGCQVYKTIDGGVSWKKIYENPISGNPFDLFVINEKKVLLAVNDNYILRTEDGGITWLPQGLEPGNLNIKKSGWIETNEYGAAEITMSADNKLWVTGKKGSIYYSDDESVSWKKPEILPDNIKEQTLRSIAFSPEGKGIVIGQYEYIMVTRDFGKSWTEVNFKSIKDQNRFEKLLNVNFIGEKGVILGKEGLYEVVFN